MKKKISYNSRKKNCNAIRLNDIDSPWIAYFHKITDEEKLKKNTKIV